MSEITHEISLDNFHHQINWALKNYCPHGLKSTQFNHVVIGGLEVQELAAVLHGWP